MLTTVLVYLNRVYWELDALSQLSSSFLNSQKTVTSTSEDHAPVFADDIRLPSIYPAVAVSSVVSDVYYGSVYCFILLRLKSKSVKKFWLPLIFNEQGEEIFDAQD